MKLVAGVAGNRDGPRLFRMFQLPVASALAGDIPAILLKLAQEIPDLHRLADGCGGHAGLAAVGGLEKPQASRAMLGVGFELVLEVRRRSVLDVAAKEFDGASAILAPELGVLVDEGFSNEFDLPEGLVAA
jgi:hypothetical protein